MDAALALAVVVLFVMVIDARGRLKRVEGLLVEAGRRIGALQRAAAEGDVAVDSETTPQREPTVVAGVPDEAALAARFRPAQRDPADAIPDAPIVSPVDVAPAEPVRETAPVQRQSQAFVAEIGDRDRDRIEGAEPRPAPAPDFTDTVETNAVAPPRRTLSLSFETLFGRTLPIWAGGITLAIAGVLIVRYAIDAGFFARVFTPPVQVVAGLLFGLGLISAAELAWRNEARLRDPRVPQALAGAGLATLYAAVLVATNVYQLIGTGVAFAGLAAITAAALGLSLRFGAPSAVLGLAGGLAAPALVGSAAPDVPLLAVYLGLTIAGLAGVARMRRWPWLAIAALVGGAGWSLWLMLAAEALTGLATLSVGALVLLIAVAVPLLALDGPRQKLARIAAAVVGTLQLALLVGIGGFAALNWGLFVLIAAAGAWLAWRDARFAVVPSISLAVSVLLLAAWPDPAAGLFAMVALALAAVHAGPLLVRMWDAPRPVRRAVELSVVALAAPFLVRLHFGGEQAGLLAAVAVGGAALAGFSAARGWRVEGRGGDARLAWLTGTAAGLAALAVALILPGWAAVLAVAAAGAALVLLARPAGDARLEGVAAGFAAAGVVALLATQTPQGFDVDGRDANFVEGARLWVGAGIGEGLAPFVSLLRWLGLAALAGLIAWRASRVELSRAAQIAGAVLVYGALAQVVPGRWLMLVPAFAGAAALLAMPRVGATRTAFAAGTFVGLSFLWAAVSLAAWAAAAVGSLMGVPMTIEEAVPDARGLVLQLALPALLLGGALWRGGSGQVRLIGLAIAGLVGAVAMHGLYRLGFAEAFGTDFVATGIPQRLLWAALLIGAGWLALRRGGRREWRIAATALVAAGTAHAVYYGLILHNPLWSAQAVGSLPLLNWLAPLFAVPWLGIMALRRLNPWRRERFEAVVQPVLMLLVGGFAWATLRQLFHGSLLAVPGVSPTENILRSLLILVLAIGYLLWGIRQGRRDWRIASLVLMLGAVAKTFLFDASGLEGLARIGSFVALGFSLIGIGWLYSRQLAMGSNRQAEAETV